MLTNSQNSHLKKALSFNLKQGPADTLQCFLSDLGEVIDVFTNPVPQDDEHRHGHLHVALLSVVAQHLPHNGTEEAGR